MTIGISPSAGFLHNFGIRIRIIWIGIGVGQWQHTFSLGLGIGVGQREHTIMVSKQTWGFHDKMYLMIYCRCTYWTTMEIECFQIAISGHYSTYSTIRCLKVTTQMVVILIKHYFIDHINCKRFTSLHQTTMLSFMTMVPNFYKNKFHHLPVCNLYK